ncbi:BspA family leucine-rich repeat surface protein [uncultured Campylobacter sp.]|uniref:BspA family leucine-rich repeat surface protein n=1 Tax=uncultured Campylobacter sp. TaxID=218934 RepID=UPI003450BA8B
MNAMFINCVNFNQSLNKWNVSKVQNMNDMFKCCIKFNQNLNSWYVSQSCVAEDMFSWADISAEDAFKPLGEF